MKDVISLVVVFLFPALCCFIVLCAVFQCLLNHSLPLSSYTLLCLSPALIILFWTTAGLRNRSLNLWPRITHSNNWVDRKPPLCFPEGLCLNPYLHWLFNLVFWLNRKRDKAVSPGWYVLGVCVCLPEWDGSYTVRIWKRCVCVWVCVFVCE